MISGFERSICKRERAPEWTSEWEFFYSSFVEFRPFDGGKIGRPGIWGTLLGKGWSGRVWRAEVTWNDWTWRRGRKMRLLWRWRSSEGDTLQGLMDWGGLPHPSLFATQTEQATPLFFFFSPPTSMIVRSKKKQPGLRCVKNYFAGSFAQKPFSVVTPPQNVCIWCFVLPDPKG